MGGIVQRVLHAYRLAHVDVVEPLGGAGGFSGAQFWKVVAGAETWCLRLWPPEQPDEMRLAWLHQVLFFAAERGFTRLPLPRRTAEGKSWVTSPLGHFELVPWIAGQADFHARPTLSRLQHALQVLGEFHQAVRDFPLLEPRHGPVPAVTRRIEMIQRLAQGGQRRLADAVARTPDQEIRYRGEALLDAFLRTRSALAESLQMASTLLLELQPCIRDIWHDHLFFVGDEVSGMVDFGAMQVDHVAVDLARLLGSLVPDNCSHWEEALRAYGQVRALSQEEQQLVRLLDRSAVYLSGINWLEWLCLEQRKFEDPARVLRRLDELLLRINRQR